MTFQVKNSFRGPHDHHDRDSFRSSFSSTPSSLPLLMYVDPLPSSTSLTSTLSNTCRLDHQPQSQGILSTMQHTVSMFLGSPPRPLVPMTC